MEVLEVQVTTQEHLEDQVVVLVTLLVMALKILVVVVLLNQL